jgi:multiple sugar transport system ATP-binding protein
VTHDQTEAVTLGDRIAVMRAGTLQQVGSPAELYAQPRNLFVAGFIGSPAMNFMPGHFEGDRLRTPIGDVDVPERLRWRLESGPGGERRDVIVGIRPEHFEDASLVSDRSCGHAFTTRIDVLESLGSEHYAYLLVDCERVSSGDLEELAQDAGAADLSRSRKGVQVVARLDAASRAEQGREAQLWFDTEQLQLFDPQSGRSLLVRDGPQRPQSALNGANLLEPRAAGQAAAANRHE